MSFSGIVQFDKNLRLLMNSEAFKEADDAQKLDLGYRLLKSKYGLGSFFGYGEVEPLSQERKI